MVIKTDNELDTMLTNSHEVGSENSNILLEKYKENKEQTIKDIVTNVKIQEVINKYNKVKTK